MEEVDKEKLNPTTTSSKGKARINEKYITKREPLKEGEEFKKEEEKPKKGKRSREDCGIAPEKPQVLCKDVNNGLPCKFGVINCNALHSVREFLEIKGKDLGDKCHLFEITGACIYGFNCRFASSHTIIGEDGEPKLMFKSEVYPLPPVMNLITLEQLQRIRKGYNYKMEGNLMGRDICFEFKKYGKCKKGDKCKWAHADSSSNNNISDKAKIKKEEEEEESVKDDDTEIKYEVEMKDEVDEIDLSNATKTKRLGLLVDKERKNIDFTNKIYIAPLTTVGNLPFRRICKEYGADITIGEMALTKSLLLGRTSELSLLRRHHTEDIFGVQLAGCNAQQMGQISEIINKEFEVDFVDINMGCPLDQVCNMGCGAAMMTKVGRLKETVFKMALKLGCPLTLKMRTGWDSNSLNAHKLVKQVQGWRLPNQPWEGSAVSAITVHGRTRQARYKMCADYEYIHKVSASQTNETKRIPIIGNGDILSYTDWEERLESEANTSIENNRIVTCMIGRGALIKPWLCTEIKERRHLDISSSERFEMLKRFTNYGLEQWGSDSYGVNNTRRFLLEWLSFLCRYIPIGILESLPQHINDRPPPFVGRNDLETLFASNAASDWVKVTEMLLGPVPEGFKFIAKHKANSYS